MRRRRGCRPGLLAILVVLLACLVFGGLAAGLVWVGDLPLHAPRVVRVEPQASAPMLPTTSFTLTFDQPMDRESVGAAFSILPKAPTSLEWNSAHDQVTLVPAGTGFEPGTTYTLRLYAEARSALFHRPLVRELSRSFFLPALLIESAPAPGTGDLGAYPELRAEFAYDLDCASTLHTFVITPHAEGQLDCQARSVVFHPTAPLTPDTAYQASLAHTFLAGDPVPRAGVSWSFRTAPPLSVLGVLPEPNRLLVDLQAPVRITFSRPVDLASAAPHLTITSGEGEPVAGQVISEPGGSTLVFHPDAPWLPGGEYHISLLARVTDELGFTLPEPVAEVFTTLPMIKVPDPTPGAADVPLDSAIVIPFTRPMDRASVEAGLTVTPALDATYTWDGDSLRVNPRGGLAASTHYTLSVAAGVRDSTGAPLGSVHRWDLYTQPFLLDVRVPTDAPLLSLQVPVTFTFALPMDQAAVRSALTISPRTPVDVSWSHDGRTLVLQPETGWQPGVEYLVRLSRKARAAGSRQEMGQDQAWPFVTAPSDVHLGIGPNAQVLPATGARVFQALHRGADAVDWHLYLLTLAQFADLYTTAPDEPSAQQPAQVGVAGLRAAGSWRQDVPVSAVDWQPISVTLPSWVEPGLYAIAAGPQPDPASPGAVPGLLLAVTDHLLVVKRAPRAQAPAPAATPPITATTPVTTASEITTTTPVTTTTPITTTPAATTTAPVTTTATPTSTQPVTATASRTLTAPVTTTAVTTATQGGPTQLLIWDTELATGAPVVSATVSIYSQAGRLLAQGTTDRQGLLRITLPAGQEPRWVVSDRAGDLAVTGLDPAWSDDPSWYGGALPPAYTIVTLPDRVVLNPGDAVRFTSIVRLGANAVYTLPVEGTEVMVRIEDGQGRVAGSQVLTTTAFATVHGVLPLPGDVEPGAWQLVTEVADDVTRTPIQVQPAAAPGIQVAVHAARSVYVVGEPITVTVSATSAEGQPLAGAPVELSVHRAILSDDVAAGALHFEPAILSAPGTTGTDGRWTVALPPDRLPAEPDDVLLALAARVSPAGGAPAAGYKLVALRPAEYSVELLLDRVGYVSGEQITLTALVLDRYGHPAAGVPVTGTLLGAVGQVVGTGSADSGEDGIVQFLGAPADTGWYQVQVATAAQTGHPLEATRWLWVDPIAGEPRPDQAAPDLAITPDRLRYAAGQVARLAVHSPAAGPALLTVERGDVHAAQPVELAAGTQVITLPIQAGDEPNVYVTLSHWDDVARDDPSGAAEQERALQVAFAELQVPAAGRQLSVTLTPGAATYAPGDEAAVQVRVVDAQGAPVRAEVSLSVVEAILPPTVEPTAGLFTTFYGPRPHDVGTAHSLAPERQLLTEPPTPPEGEGGTGIPAIVLTATLAETAYWAPALLTDASGQVTATFTLPGDPGEWQIVARAVTTDTQVGEASTRLVTTATLAIEPFLPAYLVQGDVLTITAALHSYLPQPVSATVRLDALGLALTGSPSARQQTIHLPAHGFGRVNWQAAAAELGTAEISLDATAAYRAARLAGRDAARVALPILPPFDYTASVTTYLTATAITEPFTTAAGLALRRSYHLPGQDEPVERVGLGEWVEVRLWLDVPAESENITIHERLPAGLVLDDAGVYWQAPDSTPSSVAFTARLDDGSLTFHLTRLAPGLHRFSYLARAVVEGRFLAPPAVASLLSAERAWSHSGTTRLQVGRSPD